jgi:hypothetical protein
MGCAGMQHLRCRREDIMNDRLGNFRERHQLGNLAFVVLIKKKAIIKVD